MDTQIGPYKIIREIYQGAIGQAFEALDPANGKRVTLKSLPLETAGSDIPSRLQSEAEILAGLNHPHIVRLFGFVHRNEKIHLIMEFVEGETLETILKEKGRFEPIVALGLLHQIISAVNFAHNLGVIHGNLQPSNILVTKVGLAKILDFPVSYLMANVGLADNGSKFFHYPSPEQAEGAPADARSDIYALGLLLYKMIVGKGPFDIYGQNADASDEARLNLIPVRPSVFVPNIPRWIDTFVLRALAASPAVRFQSVKAMARAMTLPVAPSSAAVPARRGRVWCQRYADRISSVTNVVLKARERCARPMKITALAVAAVSGLAARGLALRAKATARRSVRWSQAAAGAAASGGTLLALARNRLLKSSTKFSARSFQINWTRYAWATGLLILAAGEIFYFRGANLSVLLDPRFLSGPSMNEAVDAMFARLDQEKRIADQAKPAKQDSTVVVERKEEPRRKPLARPTSDNKIAPNPPSNAPLGLAERSPVYRPPRSELIALRSEKQTSAPVAAPSVKPSNVSEPSRPVQPSTPTTQLNVKWEN